MLSATHRGTCAFKNLPTEPPQAFRAGLRAFSAQAFNCPSFGRGALGLRREDAKVNHTCRQSEPYLLPARLPRGGLFCGAYVRLRLKARTATPVRKRAILTFAEYSNA
jgi:hypothetical protein